MHDLTERRERVFLVLAGTFLGAMTLLNVVGLTKFIQIGPLAVAVGVLPYPITFLCTDLISELYGRARANFVVWVGLYLNVFVIAVMYLGHILPSVSPETMPPWQILTLSKPVPLPNGEMATGETPLFFMIYACTAGSVLASMVAYMTAQFCDVYLFHFWKRVTQGKHLWLRNNLSTMASQLVDSVMVIGITFGASFLRGEQTLQMLLVLVGSNYLFKFSAALIDTLPLYFLVGRLGKFLQIDPTKTH